MDWREPPPAGIKWTQEAAELRANPGQWAVIAVRTDRSLAAQIKNGRTSALPPTDFEAKARKRADGQVEIYVRAKANAS